MKKKYKHLNQYQRDRIQALKECGHKQKDIANVLEVGESTISREIKRNRRKIRRKDGTINGNYQANIAQHKAYVRRKYAKYQGKKINEDDKLRRYIIKHLKQDWSPDEISGGMRQEKQPFYASKTSIYEWLRSAWGQRYCKYLYSQRYYKRKRSKTKAGKNMIPHRIGLDLRPLGATNRSRYGHYEGDAIVSGKKTGSKAALSVIYERKAKYADIKKIPNLKPESNNKAIINMQNKLSKLRSLTMDNGVENTRHEELNIPTFFCDPYSPWQKGGIENINKQIRRYVPKSSDISQYSHDYVRMIVNRLNNKPRKSLNYKKLIEIMTENKLLKDKYIPINKKSEVALRG